MIESYAAAEYALTGKTVDTPTEGTIKVRAIQRAGDEIERSIQVEKHGNIPSKVPEQPYNVQLGFTGGKNRNEGLSGPNYRMAIENFVEETCIVGPESARWNGTMIHDMGAVVGRSPDGELRIASSAGIRFPQELYHEANKRGFAKHTVGGLLAETLLRKAKKQAEKEKAKKISKDPHKHYTGGLYGREEFLTLPASLVLMDDPLVQGPKIEAKLRERMQNSGLRLPAGMNILSTSLEVTKNAAIGNVLDMCRAPSNEIARYDGNTGESSYQIMSLTDGFQAAFNRIETIHQKNSLPRKPGDCTLSIQSCLIPVVLGVELRYLDVATILAERIDENGVSHYYSSVSAGTEFPADVVMAAVQEGVTVGQKLAEMYSIDPADPQQALYGVSRQVLLEEAIFALFAQMQSGLEVQ